ncbi:hypothetical protein B0O99DRAFT_85676 [Bisporella sp. PMI_857]|nr:hypothetical protein B0O99DRAFT_85676 [Bisporella sp. PMI_857]
MAAIMPAAVSGVREMNTDLPTLKGCGELGLEDQKPCDLGESDAREGIAVIGFSFEFPDSAVSSEPFWEMLLARRSVSTDMPSSRMKADAFSRSSGRDFDKFTTSKACFLQGDIAAFDAPFFSISKEEAQTMDPQQRALLETTYRALENSGLPIEKVSGSNTSVYVGNFADDYKMMYCKDPEQSFQYGATGCLTSVLSSRLSWFYNLTGQSLSLDSACSSSLTAVDIACQNLLSKGSDMSIVGASNLIFSPDMMLLLSSFNVLSPEGRSFVFDQRAKGYTRGEGHAVLVLKRVSDALKDGDCIRAVIRSSGSNQDGHTPNGMAQPSRKSQEALIKQTYKKAGLSLGQTMFVEAHGTGTKLGDAVEVNAIGNSFKNSRKPGESLYIGALKANIGHLEGCSGLAGLIKTILVLERGVIPPNTGFEKANIRIEEDYLKIKFPLCPTPWPTSGLRRASVNSFGIGGSNCHVVLDDAYHYMKLRSLTGHHNTKVDVLDRVNDHEKHNMRIEKGKIFSDIEARNIASPLLLVLSSSDEYGIYRWEQLYKEFLSKRIAKGSIWDQTFFRNLAYTLACRRSMLSWKSYAIIGQHLNSPHIGISKPRLARTGIPRLGFIFTGQGAQWPRMGLELMTYPVFQKSLEEAETYMRTLGCSWSLKDELARYENDSNINLPIYSQPLCTTIQVALVDLLRSFGIQPAAVVGHSSGEIAAAYCANMISRESALKVAYFRGFCTSVLCKSGHTRGSMLAVALSEQRILPFIDQVAKEFGSRGLWIACFNSKTSLTISGDESQIEALDILLDEARERKQRLKVNVAYHSPHMEPAMNKYRESITRIEPPHDIIRQPLVMVSSVTGQIVSAEELRTRDYWVQNLVSPVNFVDAATPLCVPLAQKASISLDRKIQKSLSVDFLIEVGPHSALRGPLREVLQECSNQGRTTYLSVMNRRMHAAETLLRVVGELHCAGYPIDFSAVNNLETPTDTLQVLADLPEYPFDHSTSYWLESRISKNLRFGAYSHNELLGKPVSDWNPLDARWRNFISTRSLPWVADHEIQGQILYPAAGMLVMAMEAAKQITGSDDDAVSGYMIKDTSFHTPLIIPSKEPVEVQISLRPENGKLLLQGQTCWYNFGIYSFHDTSPIGHCVGSVAIEYSRDINGIDDKLPEETFLYYEKVQNSIERACSKSMTPKMLYNNWRTLGYNYGSRFQALESIYYGERASFAKVKVSQEGVQSSQIIHPAMLDAFMQVLLASSIQPSSGTNNLKVPTFIERLWIAKKNTRDVIDNKMTNSFKASGSLIVDTVSHSKGDIYVLDYTKKSIFAKLEGLRATQVAGSASLHEISHADFPSVMCHHITWKPDITLLSNPELLSYYKEEQKVQPEPIEKFEQLDCFLYLAISKTARFLESIKTFPTKTIGRYAEWIREQDRLHKAGSGSNFRPEWSALVDKPECFENICAKVKIMSNLGHLCLRIWESMPLLLSGEVEPLSLLFQDDLLSDTYVELNETSNWFSSLKEIASDLAHKTADMKVLEIGAGTGATTRVILEGLSSLEWSDSRHFRYLRYDFTDISSGFFEKAKEKFQDFQRLGFLTLDIEKDPVSQGFESGSYDLIVASLVLHATRDLNTTLKHARSLLRPGGKLILMEFVRPELSRFPFSMGLLPGWWLSSETFRKSGPLVTGTEWNNLLTNAGFSGTDIQLDDFESQSCSQFSLILSTAVVSPTTTNGHTVNNRIVMVAPELDSAQLDIMKIQNHLQISGYQVTRVQSLQQAATLKEKSSIFLCTMELFQPFLRSISAEQFNSLQQLLQASKSVIWATRGGGSTIHPDFAIVDGLSRVLRNEISRIHFVTVAFDISTHIAEHQLEKLGGIIERDWSSDVCTTYDNAFVEFNGKLESGRIVPNEELSLASMSLPSQPMINLQQLSIGGPKRLEMETTGILDSFLFCPETTNPDLGPMDIEIEVRAIGLNQFNVLHALGQLDQGSFANECAGLVIRVYEGCKQFQPGDRVFGWGTNVFKSHVQLDHEWVAKVPENMSYAEAACLPLSFLTAFYILDLVRARKRESILIHSAANGVGQATIQIAKLLGLSEIFATVVSAEEKSMLTEKYGILDNHIFSSRGTYFEQGIKQIWPAGIDIVIDTLSTECREASWGCVANYGRILELERTDATPNSPFLTRTSAPNISVFVVEMASLIAERRELLSPHFQTLVELLEQGRLQNIELLETYNVSEIEKAFGQLQNKRKQSKVAVILKEEALVPVAMQPKEAISFEKDNTYLIAGGLGGIGQMVARWMVGRGVQYLILLSRSGSEGHDVTDFLRELEYDGVTVKTPSCDISDKAKLKTLLEQYATEMPPIKGCVQASMILEDSLFENMSFSSWRSTTSPKIDGSWNLHTMLPHDLDFFILLSSLCGIFGQVGQANYAAGNTFQDALARFRTSLGYRNSFSLDLGIVSDAGWLARNNDVTERLMATRKFDKIEKAYLYRLLDSCCLAKPQSAVSKNMTVGRSQILVGLKALQVTEQEINEERLPPLFNHLYLEQKSSEVASPPTQAPDLMDLRSRFIAASPQDAALLVAQALRTKLALVLSFSSTSLTNHDIDIFQPLLKYGVDSLLGVELRNWVSREFAADIAVFEIMGGASSLQIGNSVVTSSRLRDDTRPKAGD